MKISLLQMCSDINVEKNIDFVEFHLRRSVENDCEMVFLPEYSGHCDQEYERSSQNVVAESESLYVRRICDLANELSTWIHIGTVPLLNTTTGKWVNRTLVVDSSGHIRARYDKIHLFDARLNDGEAWSETSVYSPGEEAVLVDTPLGLMGLTVCYDLRFPSLFAELGTAGATVFAVPAAFTVSTGRAHWEILLKARAIESGCFVIATAQAGCHADGRTTYGHSLVIDPWGQVLLDMAGETGIGTVNLDLGLVQEARRQIPAVANRSNFRGPTLY